MWLKQSYFLHHGEVSPVVPVFKNVWDRLVTKNYNPVLLLLLVKFFEKLVNIGSYDHLEK